MQKVLISYALAGIRIHELQFQIEIRWPLNQARRCDVKEIFYLSSKRLGSASQLSLGLEVDFLAEVGLATRIDPKQGRYNIIFSFVNANCWSKISFGPLYGTQT
jgi:hypothetical protein